MWVRGDFDPLLAAHARRVAECRRDGAELAVMIGEPERPLLAARARAELVAALRAVDYVCLGTEAPEEAIRIDEEPVRSEFLERVRARHGGGSR